MLFAQEGAAILGGLLCGLVFGLAIGTLIGAVILRAACALYNKMAGGKNLSSSVPEPEFGRAMLITFVTTLVNLMAGFAIGLVVGGGGAAAGAREGGVNIVAQLISLPVTILVMAGMLTAMLPTSFGRALLVTLLYIVISILIIAVIAAFYLLVFAVLLRPAP